nr:WD repeat containing protein 24 [Hymenolepis microstoma]
MESGDPTRSSRDPGGSQTEPERRNGGALGGMGQLTEVDEESIVDDEPTVTEREDPGQSRIGGSGDFFTSHSHTQYHSSGTQAMAKRSWTFDAGDPLTCIATSHFFPLIAIAGRNLLQVLRVDDDKFISVHRMTNLQRSIVSATTVNTVRPETGTSGAQGLSIPAHFQPPRSYAINDVAWSNSKSILGTCSNAGDLIIWDLSRGITQTICFVGHSRSVHRIHFNPNAPNEIISASHDGTVKLFDIRDQSCRQTFHPRTSCSSPVRDVVYCPHESHTLAGAFENGLVCIWDTRFDSRPARSFQAHNAVTASIDWHPNWNSVDRNWLATAGGRDNTVMVWDLDKSSPTTIYSLRAKNTGNVRWRVGELTQLISSCSLSLDLNIHLWELNRPYIPYITFEGHTHTIAGIAWSMDPNSFYSVARDGLLIRHYIGDGIQIAKQANSVALALNCRGALAHALGGEPGRRIRNGGMAGAENTVRRFATTIPFRDPFGANTTTAPRTHQLLVTRRSVLLPNAGLSEEERSQTMIPSEVEVPPNIIPSDDFIAQSQSELYVADFLMKDITELEAPMASLLMPDTFVYLAKNYRITGNSVEEVCNHNAMVARNVHQDFLTQFWLQLKQILGNCWQSYKPPSPPPSQIRIKRSAGKGSIVSQRNSQPLATAYSRLHSDTATQTQRNPTYAVVAGSRSGAVCVLDFIFSDDSDESRAIKTTGESISKMNKDTNSSNPTTSASVKSHFHADAAPTSLSTHSHSNDLDGMSGSLGRSSVNYLFSVDAQRNMKERQDCTGSTTATITALPEESDALIFSSMLPSLPEVDSGPSFTTASEEEQFSALVPDQQQNVEQKPSEGSSSSHQRPPEFSNHRPSSGVLDLTSSVNNAEPIDPSLISNPTLPLDFTHLVGQWFLELIEAGHAQTVCTALLLFGTEKTRINEWATEKHIENWFYVYLDALIHFRLWGVCTRIIKHCGGIQGVTPAPPQPFCNPAPTPNLSSSVRSSSLALPLARHIAILNQTGTSISVRCGKCAKPMQRNTTTTTPTGSPIQIFPHAPWACARHPSAETALSTCAVCHLTVRGIYLWCVGCSHGGHLHHIREWINKRAECPAGCGHYCEFGKLDSSLYLQISA